MLAAWGVPGYIHVAGGWDCASCMLQPALIGELQCAFLSGCCSQHLQSSVRLRYLLVAPWLCQGCVARDWLCRGVGAP